MTTRRPTTGIITIIQPYIPQYRIPLFENVRELLARDGLTLQVAHPKLVASQALRDDAHNPEWAEILASRTIRAGDYTLHVRRSAAIASRSDVVVAELASTNLDTFRLAFATPSKLILWGHGRNYVTENNRIDASLERWLARRAAHVLVYTEGGRQHLREAGIEDCKMTVLRNSTDTVALRREFSALSTEDIDAFRVVVRGVGARVGVFIGALDPSKNLALLLAASSIIKKKLPSFRLIIAGGGPSTTMVERRLPMHPEVTLLPYADRRTVALLGAVGEVCLMPGRVGLVAVDAMTLGLPVVTTDWPLHAPEREYLKDEFSSATSQDPEQFANEVVRVLSNVDLLRESSWRARTASEQYSIQHMAEQMTGAIVDVRDRRLAGFRS